MKVLLLGRGILGSAVADYFTALGYDLTVMTDRYSFENADEYQNKVDSVNADWIINALGRIPMRRAPFDELRAINVALPLQIKAGLKSYQRMIHMSSDAVFGGSKSFDQGYHWEEPTDPIDDYGRSKQEAEVCAEAGRCWVVRCSLIGNEFRSSAGLMGWYWSQTEQATGYQNHLWNGNTSLELAKVFDELIQGKIAAPGPILQVGYLPSITKLKLFELIRTISGRGAPVIPTDAPLTLNRTLIPNVVRKPIQEQLQEFYLRADASKF